MPAHYAYKEPNLTSLSQGDILRKTEALTEHLRTYHPYYADHPDYKYFMVLTQTCDLVRRKGAPCNSQYITLAAVRPVEVAIYREAAKRQRGWEKPARVLNSKDVGNLTNFVKSLLDNNKERYFYVHTDVSLGIQQNCCVFLQLAVSLKAEHYDMCLEAKICELEEGFQAKLGFQIGHMYNRIGTSEWDDHYGDNDVAKTAEDLIDGMFYIFEERQIKEGVADLKREKLLEKKTPEEIREYIDKKIVLPWKDQFKAEALNVLCNKFKPVDSIRAKVDYAIGRDEELAGRIDAALIGAGVAEEKIAAARDEMMAAFRQAMRTHLSDAGLEGKQQVFDKMLGWLMSEPTITQSLRS
jgi:hypothetical protein